MTDKKNSNDGPWTSFFYVASVLFLMWLAYGAYFHWNKLVTLDLMYWGDLLAGAFSPLAFFWLLYAALAQRAELKLQRQELIENNETQRDQQEQMKRQADALNAQIKRLNGQADAQYQPILVLLTTDSLSATNLIRLHIKNLGSDIIEVTTSRDVTITYVATLIAGEIPLPGNGVLSYFPKGTLIYLDIPSDIETDYDKEFYFEFKRLDNAKYRYEYVYKNAEQKIVLKSKIEVE